VMRFAAAHESGDGPTRTCGHVRSCAAAREKADIGGKLKTRAYWGLPLLTGSFHWQQKLNKPLFGEAFLHFSSTGNSAGHQDHTALPSASSIVRQLTRRGHRIPLPTFVTIAIRPSAWRRDGAGFDIYSDFPQWRRPATDWHDGQRKVDGGIGASWRASKKTALKRLLPRRASNAFAV